MMNQNLVCCYDAYPSGLGVTLRRDLTTTNPATRRAGPAGHRCPRKRLHAPRRITGATQPTKRSRGQVTAHGDAERPGHCSK